MTFEEWWSRLGKDGLENKTGIEMCRVICHMAFEAGRKNAFENKRLNGQTIEQWKERAEISERNLADALERRDGDGA